MFSLINEYHVIKYLLVDGSLLSSGFLFYFISNKSNSDAYRISMFFIYSFLGLLKVIVSFTVNNIMAYNISVLAISGIVLLEIILFQIIRYMNKHANNWYEIIKTNKNFMEECTTLTGNGAKSAEFRNEVQPFFLSGW